MDDISAETMQIDPFRHDAARDEDFRKEGAIEREHKALARLRLHLPIDQSNVRRQLFPDRSLLFIFAKSPLCFAPADCAGLDVANSFEVALPLLFHAAI